ncbi:AraC family transcriptional regulator [Actinophytocola sp.]|uniref:AraC family transcriptional regulator n=1 Tax=Actinophytocola sp. TaxID=1872138 RepID=UPI003D6B696E
MPRDTRELGSAWTRYQRHAFPDPSPDLARYVTRYWVVSWSYREPYRQRIVPYPNVHLVLSGGEATVRGVSSGYHVKVLEGDGRVFGVEFRPGCFRPFLGAPVSTLADRSVDAREIFGPDLPSPPEIGTVEEFLRAHLPEPDPRTEEAAEIVATISASPGIMRVGRLAAEAGMSVRALQRLFAEYVGIGPKWVIRRYRLHEVTERLAAGAEIDWASLAFELGYADQAHFVRDFRAMFGESPTRYAERY